MNDSIKFSIMTPIYNVEQYLPECIESVLAQTYGNFELILVDDGSPDSCGEICESYASRDDRIRVYHKPNGGLMQTRRFALERAEADYYVFLDSDDYLEPNTLEILERNIRESGAELVIYGFKWIRGGTGTIEYTSSEKHINRLITDKRELYNIVFRKDEYNAIWRKCVKASCFDGRDYSPYYYIKNGEDIVQSIEILENAKTVLLIPDSLYCYRLNETSITHSNNYDGYRADFTINSMVLSFLKREEVFTQEDFNRLRNFVLDDVCVRIKRICRYASTKQNKLESIASIRDADFYASFLEDGYKKAAPFMGDGRTDILRSVLNRLTFNLLNDRKYSSIITLNELFYRIAKKAGAR